MVRKRRTELPGSSTGESSEAQEAGGGRGGVQRPPAQQQQQPQQPHQQGGYQGGGRGGWAPQRGAYGGRGGGRMGPQQYYGGPPEYQQGQGQGQGRGGPPEYQQGQGRGGQQYGRGGAPRRGGYGGGRESPSAGGPPRQPAPELHQASTQPGPYGRPVETHAGPSSSFQAPEPVDVVEVSEKIEQLAIQPEVAQSQEMQPASSKSMRFPLRPGKGSYGNRCIVKANHFFAELPDKDLHQYDVSCLYLGYQYDLITNFFFPL